MTDNSKLLAQNILREIEWKSIDIPIIDDKAHKKALEMYLQNIPYKITSHIADGISLGYGHLDPHGFWEFPLFEEWGPEEDFGILPDDF